MFPFAGCGPVVVVRSPAVVGFSVGQFASDPHKENGAVFPGRSIFPLFWGEMRVFLKQVFTMKKRDLLRQDLILLWVAFGDEFLYSQNGGINFSDYSLQVLRIPAIFRHGQLPVPLVHKNRVDGGELFIRTERPHIGEDSQSRRYLI